MHNYIPDFINQNYLNRRYSGRFNAIAMLVNIGGIAQLTEVLMQKDKVGAEVLSLVLHNIYDPVIKTVYECGGFITSFAVDSFTAVFPDEIDSLYSAACAIRITRLFKAIGSQQTKFGKYNLSVKIGLSSGVVEWGITGNLKQQTYYFKGYAIDGCFECEKHANQSEIVFDGNVPKMLPADQIQIISSADGFYKLVNCEIPESSITYLQQPPVAPEVLDRFIHKPILSFNQSGEFKEIVSVYISFKESLKAISMNKIVIGTINKCVEYDGYFRQVYFENKTGVMQVSFGMPQSNENDLKNALDFVLKLQKELNDTIRIGLDLGTAYTGFIGSTLMSEYTAYGDTVKKSAAYMANAPLGKIRTSGQVAEKMADLYSFSSCGEIDLNGKPGSIAVFELAGRVDNV